MDPAPVLIYDGWALFLSILEQIRKVNHIIL
ncbi:UNVERIFIED_ORG: hypothetical protein J2X74_005450 [Bacillus sp. 1751]|nr:hypothetical protein [Bacillus sp. 1751]